MLKIGDIVRVINCESDYAGCEGMIVDVTKRRRREKWYWYAVSIEERFAQPVFYESSLKLISDDKGSDPNLLFRRRKNGLSI